MDALNTLRAVLVGCAFVAAVLLAVQGNWVPAGVMFVGILAHFWLFAYLRAEKRRAREADPLHGLGG
jgi:uncharacterized membrane protein